MFWRLVGAQDYNIMSCTVVATGDRADDTSKNKNINKHIVKYNNIILYKPYTHAHMITALTRDRRLGHYSFVVVSRLIFLL